LEIDTICNTHDGIERNERVDDGSDEDDAARCR